MVNNQLSQEEIDRLLQQEPFKSEQDFYSVVVSTPNDPFATVLKTHMYTEYILERLIHSNLERGDRIIDEGRLTYYQKLMLVDSFNLLNDRFIKSLNKLNQLRNRCAHDLRKQIDFIDIEHIARPWGKELTEWKTASGGDLSDFTIRTLSSICGRLAGETLKIEGKT